jgi:hypothetical protein
MKTYTELMALSSFEDRFLYLQEGIAHGVGDQTFGSLRQINQALYRSWIWKKTIRPQIIIRDNGCDLAIPSMEIPDKSLYRVHHINPLTPETFDEENPFVYDPENLILMSFATHQALTYGANPPHKDIFIERAPYDHLPWMRKE